MDSPDRRAYRWLQLDLALFLLTLDFDFSHVHYFVLEFMLCSFFFASDGCGLSFLRVDLSQFALNIHRLSPWRLL